MTLFTFLANLSVGSGADREGRPVLPAEVEVGPLLYANDLSAPEDIADWQMEGPGKTEFKDGWMHMYAPDEQMHHVLWCPERFPENFIAQWEAQNRETDAGLCIIFFAAAGLGEESVFASNLPPRDGTFKQYNRGAIRCYHISYYANTPDRPDRGHAHLRKNPGANMVQVADIGIPTLSEEIHRVTLRKNGKLIQMWVDDRIVIDWADQGDVLGPAYGDGFIAFRQMQWTQFRYRNLRVWEVAANQQ